MGNLFLVTIFILLCRRVHSKNPRIYKMANLFSIGWLFFSFRRYRLYLCMYNMYFIRKRNSTSCTYASAPSKQLSKLRNYFLVCLHGVVFHFFSLSQQLRFDLRMVYTHDLQCQISCILTSVDRHCGNRNTGRHLHD